MPRNRDLRKPCVRSDGKVTRHEELIRELIDSDPRMCRNGFARSMKPLFEREGIYPENVPLGEFIPDAYLLDEEAKEIRIYEVEVTNALSNFKIQSLGMFWFYMDCEMTKWMPRLYVVDRYGAMTELCMLKCYRQVLAHHAPGRVVTTSLAA
ncbi:hypothetical protein SH584_11590 [Sphingomonas sp. LY29]|uniref:hypothetical protein n=1 Tax=Sphingomonas sp. LY29 TaxID=3095341 RepID=UPI002D7987DD|nr:hypothetical protein [Sphingomonas sp. LY29]WRP25674.1 hypothetical protein SH584_11590 [Sphingomonas sp. LY29]